MGNPRVNRKPANKTPWMKKRELLESAIRHENRTMYCKTTTTEDTKIRRKIQEYIFNKFQEGKSGEEIIKRLLFVYGSKQYAKYHPYFETWVRNYEQRRNGIKRSDEGEER